MSHRKDEKLERWLESDLDPREMAEFEKQALGDEQLAEELFQAMELQAGLLEAANSVEDKEILKPRRKSMKPRNFAWAGGLMAAVLALFVLFPQAPSPYKELPLRLRGGGDAGAAIGTEPMGELLHFPRIFRWHPPAATPGTRYRWELYDAQARRRAVAVVNDSLLVRNAAETPADSLGSWRWLVIELKPNGLEGATSAAIPFSVIREKSE